MHTCILNPQHAPPLPQPHGVQQLHPEVLMPQRGGVLAHAQPSLHQRPRSTGIQVVLKLPGCSVRPERGGCGVELQGFGEGTGHLAGAACALAEGQPAGPQGQVPPAGGVGREQGRGAARVGCAWQGISGTCAAQKACDGQQGKWCA